LFIICTVSYEQVLTYLYNFEKVSSSGLTSEEENGTWVSVGNTSFLYFDGTTNEPMPRRDAVNANYHSRGIQITGFILAGIAFVFAIVSGCWVFVNRKHKLVKASQPEFLYILCVGAGLVAPSSIFFAFDENNGLTEQQLSGLCSTFPWLFVVGYLLMYCALFSKLWRLSMLLQMRRKAIHFQHVLLPCVILLTCSIVVLIIWQIVDPLSWNRKGISAVGEPYETYGECNSEKYGVLPFLIPLLLLIGLAVITTAVFSWRLRNVQSELVESQWIFAGIFLQIQTWLVGIPVLLVTHAVSIDAVYFMIVVLTFTFSTSLVGVVIGPKMVALVREKYFGEAKPKTKISIRGGSTHVSGLTIPTASNSAGEAGFLFPSTSRRSTASDDGTPKRSDISLESAEMEQLKIQNLELATEALNMQIIELEQAADQNQRLVHRSKELEARVAELELLLNQKEGAGYISVEDGSKLCI
jgi:7 transmembrane sweet-taste receptor of 3 GCPR